jgi:hypothetical protein
MTASDGSRTIVVRLEGAMPPDLAVVDALARLQLAARRVGWSIELCVPSTELCDLLDLVGLASVLPLEARGETEDGKKLGVQEVVEPGDPVA